MVGLNTIPAIETIEDFINNHTILLWSLALNAAMILAIITSIIKRKKKIAKYNAWKQNTTTTINLLFVKWKLRPPNTDELTELLWEENQRLEKEVADSNKLVKQLTSDKEWVKLIMPLIYVIGLLRGLMAKNNNGKPTITHPKTTEKVGGTPPPKETHGTNE